MQNSNVSINKRIILILLLIILTTNLIIAQENTITSNESEYNIDNQTSINLTKMHEYTGEKLPGFELEIPTITKVNKVNKITPANKVTKINKDKINKSTTFQKSEEEEYEEYADYIVLIKKPEDIWSINELAQYNKQKKEIANAMKDYVSRDTNIKKIKTNFSTFQGFSVTLTPRELDELKDNPLVHKIEKNIKVKSLLAQSVPLIGANKVQEYTIDNIKLKGDGQTVCVLDTGINYEHEDLGGEWGAKVITGHRFLNNGTNIQDCYENNSACIDDSISKHGTHISGIISANGNLIGVAPDSKLAAMKVLSNTSDGYIADVILGIEWCINNSKKYNINTISMSLGSDELYDDYCDLEYQALSAAINNATNNNITVISATGNNNKNNKISAPACIENVLRVGGVNKAEEISPYNLWAKDLILAPGENINSTTNTAQYDTKSGTSMATPHVAGAIAIMNQYYSSIGTSKTPKELFDLLYYTGTTITKQNDTYKLINLENTMTHILELNVIINNPTRRYYNQENITLNLTLQNKTHKTTYKYNNETYNYTTPTNATFREELVDLTINVTDTHNNSNIEKIQFYVDLTKPQIAMIHPENKIYNYTDHSIIINTSDDVGLANFSYVININNDELDINDDGSDINNTNITDDNETTTDSNETITNNKVNDNKTTNDNETTTDPNETHDIDATNENTTNNNIITKYHSINITNITNIDDDVNETNKTYNSLTNINFDEGNYTIHAWIEDLAGNINYKNITFIIDTPPKITIIEPKEKTYNTTNILLNITTQDRNIINTTYNWNGTNKTYTAPTNIMFEDGEHTLNAWTRDSANQINKTNITFIVDTTPPQITIIEPEENEEIKDTKPTLKLLIKDNLSNNTTCTIKLNDDETTINVNNDEVKQIPSINELAYTTHKAFVTCYDDMNNVNVNTRTFKVIKDIPHIPTSSSSATTIHTNEQEDEININQPSSDTNTNTNNSIINMQTDTTNSNYTNKDAQTNTKTTLKPRNQTNNYDIQDTNRLIGNYELTNTINKTNNQQPETGTKQEKTKIEAILIIPLILISLILIILLILIFRGKT